MGVEDKTDNWETFISDTDRHLRSSAGTPAGRIFTDYEGNRVREWITEDLNGTTHLLRRLDRDDLKLEETQIKRGPALGGEESSDESAPYNDAGSVKPRRRG